MERDGGSFLLVRTEAELGRILAELRRLNRLRIRSKGGLPSLDRDDLFAFLGDVCARFRRRGWLRLQALQVAGNAIALSLNFAFGGKVYGYLSGFDRTWTRHGIGTVLMRDVVRSAVAEGYREYEFLRGSEDYKQRWTWRQRRVSRLRIVNRRLRYWAFSRGRLASRACDAFRDRLSGARCEVPA